ncbi:MAG: DUF2079 domain-containing protein [Candidatus Kerfeldbacteria bacterium]
MGKIMLSVMKPHLRIPRIVWVSCIAYCVVFSAVCIAKYFNFQYPTFDLAIFDQVLWNSSHFRWYEYSFNPYSYLVDHRSWLLMAFVPLYWVAGHPITLLVAQTIALGSGALPLYFIAKRALVGRVNKAEYIAAAVSVLYLIHPTVQQMNLFEFHMLPFVIPVVFWLWLALDRKKWAATYCLVVLLLLLREDLAFMTIGVGVLVVLRHGRKYWFHGAAIAALSIVWLISMLWVASFFSPDDTVKFMMYFEHYGSTPGEVARAFLFHPVSSIAKLFGNDHAIALFYLIASIGMLSFFKVRYLVPALGPFLFYFMIDRNIIGAIVASHHAAVIFPWLLISAVYGIPVFLKLLKRINCSRLGRVYALSYAVGLSLLAYFIMFFCLFSPLREIPDAVDEWYHRDVDGYRTIVQSIGDTEAVMASRRFWPLLSHREHLYSNLGLFTGKMHFSDTPYQSPTGVSRLIMEHDVIFDSAINIPDEEIQHTWQRVQQVLDDNDLIPAYQTQDAFVFARKELVDQEQQFWTNNPATIKQPLRTDLQGDLMFLGWNYAPDGDDRGTLSLAFEKMNGGWTDDDQQLELQWFDSEGKRVKEHQYALGFSVVPTHTWLPGESYAMHLPVVHPAGAARVAAVFGPVVPSEELLQTLKMRAAIIDPDNSTSIGLDGLLD